MAKIYRYPYDMMDRSTDYMLIESIEYKPSRKLPDFTSTNSAFQRLKTEKAKYNIVLPMPNQIAQANTVGWGESRISALAGTGVNAIKNGLTSANQVNGLVEGASKGLSAIGETLKANAQASALFSTASKQYIQDYAATAAVNAVAGSNIRAGDILARTSGKIVNQNLELLFNGVSLRPFNFAWDLTPRDEKEAGVIREILYKLKQSSAARRSDSAFLGSPDVWRISYRKGTQVHGFLNRFKICAITNVGINYTGSGQYASYNDSMGTPVHMQLSLNFTELEPIYREDYDQYQGGSGF